jgi:hypothetical protein
VKVTKKRAAPAVVKIKEETPKEDKRSRNTAASARFRVKKKLREQEMEHSIQLMTDKSEKLEDKVQQLEAEIKFLRNLLLEKNKASS